MVGGLEHFFPCIGDNPSHWLIFFRGVGQPPTSYSCILLIYIFDFLEPHPQVANDAEALMLQFAVTDPDASQGTPAMVTLWSTSIAMENCHLQLIYWLKSAIIQSHVSLPDGRHSRNVNDLPG